MVDVVPTQLFSLPRSAWPETSFRQFFVYETAHPQSLSASVIQANSDRQTYLVTGQDFPVQTITHASGSSWAGEHTHGGSLTSWGCALGSGSDDVLSDQYGVCHATTVAANERLEPGSSTAVNSCFVEARSVLVFITAGMDKMYSDFPYVQETWLPEQYISAQSEALASLNCPATETTPAHPKSTMSLSSSEGNNVAKTSAVSTSTQTGANETPETEDEHDKSDSTKVSTSLVVLSLLSLSCILGSF